jgi:hypothetical protein
MLTTESDWIMNKNSLFLPYRCALLLVAITFSGRFALANSAGDVLSAFRSPAITEVEFLARSISFGATPIATLLVERRPLRPEPQRELQVKLVSAQLEWIELQSAKNRSTDRGAIDALLDLEHTEDWNEETQNIFLEFLVRKATLLRQERPEPRQQLDQLHFKIARHIKQRSSDTVSPETQRTAVFHEARELADSMMPSHQSFDSLPDDVVGVLVDGAWYPKSQGHFAMYVSPDVMHEAHDRNKVRLTFISNLYQPKTLMIAKAQQINDLGPRQTWVRSTNPCSVDSSHYLPISAPVAVVGNDSCEALIGLGATNAPVASLKQISDFGRGNIPQDPFRSTAPIEQPPVVRPWVWAAIGSVAIMALVISARTQETQIQPTVSSGW